MTTRLRIESAADQLKASSMGRSLRDVAERLERDP